MVARTVAAIVLTAAGLAAAAESGAGYVGAAACARCHVEQEHRWSQSRHSKMVQPATASSVKGDFTRGQIKLRGGNYRLRERNGVYYISEAYLTGTEQEHRVDYTLGNRRIQHYLTTLPSGRIIVLPPSWDVLRKAWFHNFDIGDPDETSEVMVQVWNKNCYSCHVSQEEKNFDAATNQYKTAWLDFGTNCERCHGPGSEHVAHYSSALKPPGAVRDIVLQTRLSPARNTGVCAQCHSFRDIEIQGYTAGSDYYDYFMPVLEYNQPVDKDPAYWPDGRTRRFSNDALGLWQSECYLQGGVTCVSCHVTAHETEIEKNPQLRPDANALCARCHEAIGKAVTAHSHHAVNSTGSSCVECHMPRTVLSIKAAIRDHSMSIPVPENTMKHSIPNACNVCHTDRDAAWSLKQMKAWYGDNAREKLIRRADAFAMARGGDPAAIPKLLEILKRPAEGALVRGNAAGYLSRFPNDPRSYPALAQAAADSEPLVRAIAMLRISPSPSSRDAAVNLLVRGLADPVATVRLNAGVTLVTLNVPTLSGIDAERMARAQQAFRARAELNSDDPASQLGAGKFYLLTGDSVSAIRALENSLKLEPDMPAQYFLAYAHAQQREYREAREILVKIPPNDPQYGNAQQLLNAIAGHF
ncbi:MAG TPA: HEAT repeat domain-containing protein [Bryobacteraceae bacterium]|nr:HEAT repeat domain-containing protein [Bryobacteraceae bacterium]